MKTLFSLSLCLGALSSAVADEASTLKAHIQSEMNKASQFLLRKDVSGCEKVLRANFDKNFYNVDSRGTKVTLDQQISQMKVQVAAIKAVKKVDFKVVSLKVKGNKAESIETMEIVMVFNNPQTKKDTTVRQTSKGISTLAKKNGKWWVMHGKDTESRLFVDGKEIKQK